MLVKYSPKHKKLGAAGLSADALEFIALPRHSIRVSGVIALEGWKKEAGE